MDTEDIAPVVDEGNSFIRRSSPCDGAMSCSDNEFSVDGDGEDIVLDGETAYLHGSGAYYVPKCLPAKPRAGKAAAAEAAMFDEDDDDRPKKRKISGSGRYRAMARQAMQSKAGRQIARTGRRALLDAGTAAATRYGGAAGGAVALAARQALRGRGMYTGYGRAISGQIGRAHV